MAKKATADSKFQVIADNGKGQGAYGLGATLIGATNAARENWEDTFGTDSGSNPKRFRIVEHDEDGSATIIYEGGFSRWSDMVTIAAMPDTYKTPAQRKAERERPLRQWLDAHNARLQWKVSAQGASELAMYFLADSAMPLIVQRWDNGSWDLWTVVSPADSDIAATLLAAEQALGL